MQCSGPLANLYHHHHHSCSPSSGAGRWPLTRWPTRSPTCGTPPASSSWITSTRLALSMTICHLFHHHHHHNPVPILKDSIFCDLDRCAIIMASSANSKGSQWAQEGPQWAQKALKLDVRAVIGSIAESCAGKWCKKNLQTSSSLSEGSQCCNISTVSCVLPQTHQCSAV